MIFEQGQEEGMEHGAALQPCESLVGRVHVLVASPRACASCLLFSWAETGTLDTLWRVPLCATQRDVRSAHVYPLPRASTWMIFLLKSQPVLVEAGRVVDASA